MANLGLSQEDYLRQMQAAQAGPVQNATTQTYNAQTAAAPQQAGLSQYQAQTAGPAAQAVSQGYQATNANLNNAYSGMGWNNPTAANQQLLSGQVNNPYLDRQADNIQNRLNRNLQENIMPGIGQGATAAGQYGSSRQGIAQGKAISDTQDNLAGQLANLYGTANENAQNRMASAAQNLSGLGAQVELANAGYQNQASQFGANAANTAAMFNAGQTNAQNQFNTSQANQAGLANSAASNQNSQFNAGQTNASNQFNAAQQNAAGQFNAGAANAANLANSAAANQQNQFNAGQQNSFNLGNASNINQATANANNLQVGMGQVGAANAQAAASMANANNQATANANNYALGLAQNQNQANSIANQLALGNAANQNQSTSIANQYDLGKTANTNNANQIANSYNLGLGGLALTNQGQMQNFYTNNRQLDQSGLALGANLYGQGATGNQAANTSNYNTASGVNQAPLTALQNYGTMIAPYTGLGGSQTVSGNAGGGLSGALGGALAGAQLYGNLGFGASGANPYTQLVAQTTGVGHG